MRFVTTFGAAGVTGLLAAFAMILLAGGYLTVCRVTELPGPEEPYRPEGQELPEPRTRAR
jgi:hypothetical protein